MTVCNDKRRKHFREGFEKETIGNPLDLEKLRVIGKTKKGHIIRIPRGTITAFLRELNREGLVRHETWRWWTCGRQFDLAVWSRIK